MAAPAPAPAAHAAARHPPFAAVQEAVLHAPFCFTAANGRRWTINPTSGRVIGETNHGFNAALDLWHQRLLGGMPLVNFGAPADAAGAIAAHPTVARAPYVAREILRPAPDEAEAIAGHVVVVGTIYRQNFIVRQPGLGTIHEFAERIHRANLGVPAGAIVFATRVRFHDEDDANVVFRMVHGTANEIADQLGRLQHGQISDQKSLSDPLDIVQLGFVLDPAWFQITYKIVPRVAGLKTGLRCWRGIDHPHFNLTDFAAETKNDNCLFATLRAIASMYGLALPSDRPDKLRATLAIPAGPIAPTLATLEKLAPIYGLRIRAISGVSAPNDSARVYSDNQHRSEGRNRCASAWSLDVYAEAGAADAPRADIYVDSVLNHCFHISSLKDIHVCPVTGDVLLVGADGAPIQLTDQERRRRVIAQGRKWFAKTVAIKAKRVLRERVIVFDYETTFNRETGELEPYALGWLEFDPAKPPMVNGEIDFTALRASVNITVLNDGNTPGQITESLIEYIEAVPQDVRITLVGFNNSRFDNYLLASALARAEALNGVFATSGGLRNISTGPLDDRFRHTTLDLAKLVPGSSLADCCEGFKCLPRKVEGFSHRIPQNASAAGRLRSWITESSNELLNYLEGDVLATACLFSKLAKAFDELTKGTVKIIGNGAITTAGGAAWSYLNTRLAEAGSPMPAAVADHELDNHIRSAIIGGRTQLYAGVPQEFNEPLRMIDFASLYPTVMAAPARVCGLFDESVGWGLYPDEAEPEAVTAYAPGVVGIYTVRIKAQPALTIIPQRRADAPLNWAPSEEFVANITHCDVALLLQHGADIEIINGYIWRKSTRGKFAHFIEPLAAEKDRQDTLKAAKSPEYNAPLRELCKLLQNSASGKMCQKNFDELCILARTEAEKQAAISKFADLPSVEVNIVGSTVLMFGKKPASKIYRPTRAKPSIMAVLIYSYARSLLYRVMAGRNPIYGDTDSICLRQADYEAMREEFPMLDPENATREGGAGKRMGDLEEELGDYASCRAYFIQAKEYAIILSDAAGKQLKKSKLRSKGVCIRPGRADRIILDNIDDNFIALSAASLAERDDEFNRAADAIDARTFPIDEHLDEYFRARVASQPVHVLCGQIQRLHRDAKHPFTLRQRYIVKTIGAAEHKPEAAPAEQDSDADDE